MSGNKFNNDGMRYGGAMLALGVARYTVISNKLSIESYLGIDLSFIESYFASFISCLLLVVGILLIIISALYPFFKFIFYRTPINIVKKIMTIKIRAKNLTLSPCNTQDIIDISKLAEDEFGNLAASQQRNQHLFNLDNSAYVKVSNDFGKIIGFYDLFRLTKLGEKSINRGDFDITICPNEYIRCDKKTKYNPLYICGVYGNDSISKAMLMGALNLIIAEIKPRKIYARAASSDGLRLLTKYGFSPVLGGPYLLGALYVKSL